MIFLVFFLFFFYFIYIKKMNKNTYWCSFEDLFIVCFIYFYTSVFWLQNFLIQKHSLKIISNVRNKIIKTNKSSYQLEDVIRPKKCFLWKSKKKNKNETIMVWFGFMAYQPL